MRTTDTTENGLELAIDKVLTETNGFERGNLYGTGEYNREYAVDEVRLFRFLEKRQAETIEALHILVNDLEKVKFLKALSDKIRKDGIIEVLRHGMRYRHLRFDLYEPANTADFDDNIWSVTRQLRYSEQKPNLALDICVFLNGLPIITLELKNGRSKWSTVDAMKQYCDDRNPKEPWNASLFGFKKCLVHFAVDTETIMMCTRLEGEKSWFLPFNKGYNDGAGNPPGEIGFKTGYLWEEILTKTELANIIQNYALYSKNDDKQIFPRWHQLKVVKSLLADVQRDGSGHKYLVQHSAGSGKSNSIAWLALQLVPLKKGGLSLFDTVLVVTDRVNLDKQIRNTLRDFADVKATVGWAKDSTELKNLLAQGKKIIITVIHKFDVIISTIGNEYKNSNFAIIIDEAHSSQSGRLSAKMNIVVSGNTSDDDDELEDKINALIAGRKMAKNASYFAFTATPKNKTLENFGLLVVDENGNPILNEDGEARHDPHYVYTMKQAIEEDFILDVLKNYTHVDSYYNLVAKVKNDPQFNKKKAAGILRYHVESTKRAVEEKSGIVAEHFLSRVKQQIGGKARAMVVCQDIARAVKFYKAITDLLANTEYKAIIAFSGEDKDGKTESAYNGFASNGDISKGEGIEGKFKTEPYRILVVADKFQTGFDEPLLQTMYVDKTLTDIKAVQTLSRLNRAYPGKKDPGVFVLDFVNDAGVIKKAFDRYYLTTVLIGETDPNKLNTLIDSMERLQIYTQGQVDEFVSLFLENAPRERLEPILNDCKEKYKALEVEEQVLFKSNAKNFVRTYGFLAAILPYGSTEWEKLSIFLNVLKEILPTPDDDDLTKGLWESVDLASYRSVAKETMSIALANEDAEIAPIPVPTDVGIPVPELESLSKILEEFNKVCGGLGIKWTHKEEVEKQVLDLPNVVKEDESYQAAVDSRDDENVRIEAQSVTNKVINTNSTASYELQRAIAEHPELLTWIVNHVFKTTYTPADIAPSQFSYEPPEENYGLQKVAESVASNDTIDHNRYE
jgi:type I restriction enzyme R subunit